MNSLFVGVLILFVVCGIYGYMKGFVKIVFSLVATLVTIVLVGVLTPMVTDALVKYTPMEEVLADNFSDILLVESEEEIVESSQNEIEIPLRNQIEVIEKSNAPEYIKNLLLDNNNGEIYEKLGVTTFADYVGAYLAKWMIGAVAFIITFLIAIILVRIFVFSLDVVTDLPIFGGINRFAGAVACLGFALIIVWFGFTIVMLTYATEFGQTCSKMIEENWFLTYLNDNNMIMNILTK